jgi:hypothetical protein
MHTARLLISVFALCGIAAAADSLSVAPNSLYGQTKTADTMATKAAAEVKAPAMEPAVVAPVDLVVEKNQPLAIKWSGMAMLRFREDIKTNFLKSDTVNASAELSQRIAFKIGAEIKPNDETLLQFELGNDWYGTEQVDPDYTKRGSLYPWFTLAYVQWNPGYMHVAAGIIPVKGTALMDLLGVSLVYDRSYQQASQCSWGIVTNLSQTGLRIGAPILKDGFKLGVDVMTAVIQQRGVSLGIDTMKLNAPAWEILLGVPMEFAKIAMTPQAFAIPNRSYNKETQKGDFEFGAGVDFGYNLNDNVQLRAGFAVAQNANSNSAKKNDTLFSRLGTNSNIGSTMKVGPGKLDIDLSLSSEYNDKNQNVNDLYPYADFKYGWTINKNFMITPRCRLYFVLPEVEYDYKLNTRPEVIFTGSF